MKYHLLIVLVVFGIYACTTSISQSEINIASPLRETDQIENQLSEKDTLFIERNNENGIYHAVYIEKNRDSRHHKKLLDFRFKPYESEMFNNFRKEGNHKLVNMFDLPQNWVPLIQYNDQNYLYAPCDNGNARKRIITDSCLVYWHMDGPDLQGFTDSKKLDNNTYRFFIERNKNTYTLTIHIIDHKTQMAVWEFSNESETNKYRLFVPTTSAAEFDLIVNYCPDQKMREFIPNSINFEELLSLKGKK